jgi:hypothetical protein
MKNKLKNILRISLLLFITLFSFIIINNNVSAGYSDCYKNFNDDEDR